jgi:hypothetical protein
MAERQFQYVGKHPMDVHRSKSETLHVQEQHIPETFSSVHLLYLKPTHTLILNTLSHPHFKTLILLRVHDQTTHRQVHRAHIHIDGILPHTEYANNEASKRRSGNALSTKDDP